MANEYFFRSNELEDTDSTLITILEDVANSHRIQIFVLQVPLSESKYKYDVNKSYVALIPKHKVFFINEGDTEAQFEDYIDDFTEDIGSLSDKFNYRELLGRTRSWSKDFLERIVLSDTTVNSNEDLLELIERGRLLDPATQRRGDLLISLISGSINDIERLGEGVPANILEKVKRNIRLFDGEQTKFIFNEAKEKSIRIQGLSGTGKTELLLHRLKEMYVSEENSKILFTCHNKILASSLRNRIPSFFNFMRVEKQIEWNERLWCVHAWGSRNYPDSGAYRKICEHYQLKFRIYSPGVSFDYVCSEALKELKAKDVSKYGHLFDYVFIDESQDFPMSFISLCEKVTRGTVFIAGDIFQSIFDENILGEVEPDYLLSKCYRTDPKTLMFAHALGLGLFEKKRFRWLKDEEWEACGYKFTKNGKTYTFTREPLRRFEDIPNEGFKSVEIVRSDNTTEAGSYENVILKLIEEILADNPSARQEDIGITFSGASNRLYKAADRIQYLVEEKLGFNVNIAYRSKSDTEETMFLSNKNNVKGLEFPFLICFADRISSMPNERNALYMLLTRSFIKSYLVVSELADEEQLKEISAGLDSIFENDALVVEKPDPSDILDASVSIKSKGKSLNIAKTAKIVFDEYEVNSEFRKSILSLMKSSPRKFNDMDSIREFIELNLERLY